MPPIPTRSPSLADLGHDGSLERRRHGLAEVLHLSLRGRIRGEEPIAHAEGPERERPGSIEPAVAEARELHAPAAHVHRGAVHDRQVVHGAHESEPCLEVPVDHFQGDPERPRLLDEPLSVAGLADRGRRDRDHPVGSRSVGDRLEIAERLDGPVDRLRSEAVIIAQLPTESERGTCVLQHVQVLARAHTEDDHPCRVRPDVHDRERPDVLSGSQARFHGPMLPHESVASEASRTRVGSARRVPRMLLRDDDPLPDPSRRHRRDGIAAVRPNPGIHLDERGRRQAAALVERFDGVRLNALYSSPLERCVETLEPLAETRGLEIRVSGSR